MFHLSSETENVGGIRRPISDRIHQAKIKCLANTLIHQRSVEIQVLVEAKIRSQAQRTQRPHVWIWIELAALNLIFRCVCWCCLRRVRCVGLRCVALYPCRWSRDSGVSERWARPGGTWRHRQEHRKWWRHSYGARPRFTELRQTVRRPVQPQCVSAHLRHSFLFLFHVQIFSVNGDFYLR